jgi:hypothetical protein
MYVTYVTVQIHSCTNAYMRTRAARPWLGLRLLQSEISDSDSDSDRIGVTSALMRSGSHTCGHLTKACEPGQIHASRFAYICHGPHVFVSMYLNKNIKSYRKPQLSSLSTNESQYIMWVWNNYIISCWVLNIHTSESTSIVAPHNVGPNNVGPNNVGPNNVGPHNVGRLIMSAHEKCRPSQCRP